MKRIYAESLLDHTTEDLWELLTGEFILVFPDGVLRTNAHETLYSSYAWEFHRRFRHAPLRRKHHVSHVLGGGRLSADTHLELLGRCMWNVYDTYTRLGITDDPIAVDRDPLSEMVYRLVNRMYNDLSYRCEEYVVSLDIVNFLEVMDHPAIKAANDEFAAAAADPKENYKSLSKKVEKTYKTVTSVLEKKDAFAEDTSLDHNPIALGVRSKFAKLDSVLQCVSVRGFLTETDSEVFERVPVTRGYAMGLRLFVDSFVESRSAAKSLIFSKTPLQQAEYFSRRLQLMSQIVQSLHHVDCATLVDRPVEYLEWTVRDLERKPDGRLMRPSDLKMLVGKHYVESDAEGRPLQEALKTFHGKETHLYGKKVHIRSVLHCAHPDPYGVCSTCFGELSLSVPRGTNLGHMCCTSMTQKSSQSVLSVKHMDSSSAVEGIVLDDVDNKFLRVGADDNTYYLNDYLKAFKVTLVLPPQSAQKLTDVMWIPDVRSLTPSRVSEIEHIFLWTEDPQGRSTQMTKANIQVSLGRRMAYLTYEMLEFIRERSWDVDAKGYYLIDMTGWDWDKPVLGLPLKHFNMADHSRDIAETLEANVEQMQLRDKDINPDEMLLQLFDLINAKLTVNLAVVEVTQLGAMIRSAEKFDYALPKPWTDRGVGVMSLSMAYRSLSAAMAYENHRDNIVNPMSYVLTNRPDHPMDAILMPREVLGDGVVLPPPRTTWVLPPVATPAPAVA